VTYYLQLGFKGDQFDNHRLLKELPLELLACSLQAWRLASSLASLQERKS